jgi:sec-independent protein translocase protein TatB
MFDISWGELMLIGVVALIVIGPKELPGVLRMVGQWMGKIRRMAAEFQSQFQEAMREAEMSDLKKQVDELNDTARGMSSQFDPLSPSPNTTASSKPADVAASATPSQTVPADAPAPAVATEPVAAQPLPDVSVPSPEPVPAPEKDFASAASEPMSPTVPREVEGDRRA